MWTPLIFDPPSPPLSKSYSGSFAQAQATYLNPDKVNKAKRPPKIMLAMDGVDFDRHALTNAPLNSCTSTPNNPTTDCWLAYRTWCGSWTACSRSVAWASSRTTTWTRSYRSVMLP